MSVSVDPDLVATMRDVLVASAPTPRDPATGVTLDEKLWAQLEELGLARLTGSEASGGSGAGWAEAAALLDTAARLGVALPVVEHDLLAGWLLERLGLAVDPTLRTLAVLSSTGEASSVPWARTAGSLVCVWPAGGGWLAADVPAESSSLSVTAGVNLAGEPRDAVSLDVAAVAESGAAVPVSAHDVELLGLRGALARAVQVAGALERCLELVVEHVTTRVQFGRPLARFQAVQHLVADIAAEAALARAAVGAGVRAAEGAPLPDLAFRVAVARSCTGHAASTVVRNSHQALGAIGTTLEHELHRHTLAALAWRGEYGATAEWDARVAEAARDAVAPGGSAGLWELITG